MYPRISITQPQIVFVVTNRESWDISYGKQLAALKKHGFANYFTSMVESNGKLPQVSPIGKLIDAVVSHLNVHVMQNHVRFVTLS